MDAEATDLEVTVCTQSGDEDGGLAGDGTEQQEATLHQWHSSQRR